MEDEHPQQELIQCWGQAIGKVGKRPFDLGELTRLQRVGIGDARVV